MNYEAFNFLWGVVSAVLRGDFRAVRPEVLDVVYLGDVELPTTVEDNLTRFVGSRDQDDFSTLALELVRRFHMVNVDPSAHLLILGYLVANDRVSVREAVKLAQVSREEFSSSQDDGVELARSAQRVEEEERMGFLLVDEDRFFVDELAAYCRAHGFDFATSD